MSIEMKPHVYMTGSLVQTPTYNTGELRSSVKTDSGERQFPRELAPLDGRLNPEALFYSRRSSASSRRRHEHAQALRFATEKVLLSGREEEAGLDEEQDLCHHLREEAACRVLRRGLSGQSSVKLDDSASDVEVVSLSDWNMCEGFIFASPLDQISRTLRSNALYELPGSVFRGTNGHGPGSAVRLSPGCSQMEHLRRISHNLLPADDVDPFTLTEPEAIVGGRGIGGGGSLSQRHRENNERLLRRLIMSRRRTHPVAMQNPFLSDEEEEEDGGGGGGGGGEVGEGDLCPMAFPGFSNTPQTCIYARRLVAAFLTGGMTWREVYRRLLPQSLTEQNIFRFGAMTDSQKQLLFFGASKLGFLSALSHPKYKLPDGSRLQPHPADTRRSAYAQTPMCLTDSLACTIENAASTTFLDRWGVVRSINGPFWPLRHGPLMPAPRIRGYKLRESGKPDVSSFSLARQQQVLSRLIDVKRASIGETTVPPIGLSPQPSKPLLVFDTELSSPLEQRLKQWQQRASFPTSDVDGQASGSPFLLFESRFESGNLRQAYRVGPYEYELILNTDLWTKRHTQWYFFMVCGAQTGVVYTFKILNLLKPGSLYSQGMQPLLYSEKLSKNEGIGWIRVGTDITYAKKTEQPTNHLFDKDLTYYKLRWKMAFPYDGDRCCIAHCFPYTYTDLHRDLRLILDRASHYTGVWKACHPPDSDAAAACSSYVQCETLCPSLAGNSCYLLTVTDPSTPVEEKFGAVISARVHPGETNGSWMMRGLMNFLTSPHDATARELRRRFVFKLIPMLNADGVIVGNYRCSLLGKDLNRQYQNPNEDAFPELFHTKSVVRSLSKLCKEVIVCDLHGHNRRTEAFMYGCDSGYRRRDPRAPHPRMFSVSPEQYLLDRLLPYLLSKQAPSHFSFPDCRFAIQPEKEGSARIVFWRQLRVDQSFTLEASFAGTRTKDGKMKHFDVYDLEEIGCSLARSLLDLHRFLTDREKYNGRLLEMGKEILRGFFQSRLATGLAVRGDNRKPIGDAIERSTDTEDELENAEAKLGNLISSVSNFGDFSKAMGLLANAAKESSDCESSRISSSSDSQSESELDIRPGRAVKKVTYTAKPSQPGRSGVELTQQRRRRTSKKRRRRRSRKHCRRSRPKDAVPVSQKLLQKPDCYDGKILLGVSSHFPKVTEDVNSENIRNILKKYEGQTNGGIPCFVEERLLERTCKRLNYLKSEGLLEAEPYQLEPDLQGVDTTGQNSKVGRLDMHEFEVCVQFWKSLLRRQQCFGANRGNKRLAPTSVANQSVQPATRMEEPTALKVIALDDQEKVMRSQLEEIRKGIEELLRQRRRSRRRQIKQ
ncbi:hypothetical protein SprV_0902767700 [Sparganum proliferum]